MTARRADDSYLYICSPCDAFSMIPFHRLYFFVTLGRITETELARIEAILHIVLKFKFDRVHFQRGEAITDFDVANNTVSTYPAQMQ